MTTINLLKRRALLTLVFLFIAMGAFVSSASAQAPNFPDPKNAVPDKDGIYNTVETLPSFPGGLAAFSDFLKQNIKYPAADKEHKLTGKVFAQFVVERDGSLSNIQAIRSPSDAMAQEAIRVLKSSPKWSPGTQNGKVVRARYTIPIAFNL